MPEVILAEEKGQALKVLAFQAVLEWSFPHLDDIVHVLEDLERLSPEPELGGHLELLHSYLDVTGIHVGLLNIDVDGLLLFVLITLAECSLQPSSQTLAEALELLHSVISINEVEYLAESSHVDIL